MIDIHCHLLPDVDDGSTSWDVSLQMCEIAANDGIEHIVATPHANSEYVYDRPYLQSLVDELRRRLSHRLSLSLGCDFHFSYENIQELLKNPERFTISDTNYLLVEFSDFSIPPSTTRELKSILDVGLKPIITHPERNPLLQQNPSVVLEWVSLGCLVQVTGNTLTGRWGRRARATAEWLMENNAVHVLASDAHGTRDRTPVLSEARTAAEELVGPAKAVVLVDDHPRAIVSGRDIQ
ncbi:MAG TPA: CpsB/CapC family capsule biosynthesis tyrosine phosphatase [Terriglobales bacterium]|nr:CpsB/CapC family capsule biosynthesis tyrosine phosphatase [Terriglobales bacterium]